MELVVDANVLLSCFMKDGTTRTLLLDYRLALFAPEHLILETTRHLSANAAFRKRIRASADEIKILFEVLTQRIKTIPFKNYTSFMKEASSLAAHSEDTPYFALALCLKVPLWSNDGGFQKQRKVKTYTTAELIKSLL